MKKSVSNNMIRSILIIGYIVVVLLVSGLAHAELAEIKTVRYDAETHALHIQGAFASTCQVGARPVVRNAVEGQNDVLTVAIDANRSADANCLQQTTGRYDMVFDIRTFGLPTGRAVTLKFENVAQGENSTLPVYITDSVDGFQGAGIYLEGRLIAVAPVGFARGPRYALVGNGGKATLIESIVDLDPYLNTDVRLSGIPLNQRVVPAVDDAVLNFGSKRGSAELDLVFASTIEVSAVPLQ